MYVTLSHKLLGLDNMLNTIQSARIERARQYLVLPSLVSWYKASQPRPWYFKAARNFPGYKHQTAAVSHIGPFHLKEHFRPFNNMANDLPKRLIVCCDGTWMDRQVDFVFYVTTLTRSSDDGFTKPTLIPYVPTGTLQVQSNVTRISRALRRVGLDGIHQIIYYHSGVGTGSSVIDTITGGLLGTGISENIREAYSFIAANYESGDEIILIGFSRGAFTARSVAGMIRDIGLLTRGGMDTFYPIFKDQENFRNHRYHDIFPTIPFSNKPFGPNAARDYKRRLEEVGPSADLTKLLLT
jgi:hypothetical protein